MPSVLDSPKKAYRHPFREKHGVIPDAEFFAAWEGYVKAEAYKLASGFLRFGLDHEDLCQLGRMGLMKVKPGNRWSTNYVRMVVRNTMFAPWEHHEKVKRKGETVSLERIIEDNHGDPITLAGTMEDPNLLADVLGSTAHLDLDRLAAGLKRKQMDVVNLVRRGLDFDAIAVKLKITRSGVHDIYGKALLRMGAKIPAKHRKGPPMTRDLAKMGCYGTYPGGRPKPSTGTTYAARIARADKVEAAVLALKKKGKTHKEIGKELGITTHTVNYYAHRNKVRA